MSNSPLVSYTKISPNKTSPRNHAIDTVTIHCTAGNKDNTAKQIADYFSNSARGASCNYAVGGDGSIAMSVEEKDRSWCTSSGVNDHRAITIEVCSNIPGTEVNDRAYAALLDLLTDICKRNGIKKLVWSTAKNDRVNHLNGCNMTVHRDYANKSCPGEWLYSRHTQIASEVNKRLGSVTISPEPEKPTGDDSGAFKVGDILSFNGYTHYSTANAAKGQSVKPCRVKVTQVYKTGKHPYHVRAVNTLGAFTSGVYGWVDAADLAPLTTIKVGSKVKVLNAITYTGKSFKTYYDTYDVLQMSGDRVVIGIGKTVTAAINIKNIQAV